VRSVRRWIRIGRWPRGVFSRQLFLGESLDAERIHADYTDGVLRLTIPVAERAKPRKIEIDSHVREPQVVNA
jgi:HSP20 family protein